MAELRDELGNPVQLTDEFGNPVQLTDEHGNPMHITGLATSEPLHISSVERTEVVEPIPPLLVPPSSSPTIGSQATDHGSSIADTVTGASTDTIPPTSTEIKRDPPEHTTIGDALTNKQDVGSKEMEQTSSSSSGSSEDDGQGGRRKKKGLKQKIKEKLTGGNKHKEDQLPSGTHMTTTTTTGGVGEHHEKKSMLEKIKEKLPRHH